MSNRIQQTKTRYYYAFDSFSNTVLVFQSSKKREHACDGHHITSITAVEARKLAFSIKKRCRVIFVD